MNPFKRLRIAWLCSETEVRDYYQTTSVESAGEPRTATFTPARAVQLFRGFALNPIVLEGDAQVTSIAASGVEMLVAPVPWELFCGLTQHLFEPVGIGAGAPVAITIDPRGKLMCFTVLARWRAVERLALWPRVKRTWALWRTSFWSEDDPRRWPV